MASGSTSSVSCSNKESLEDCMCTICLCILIHPVTLPCGHELCMPCFKQTVEEASLTCPLCRTRISTWTRKASRTNTLVNQKRWEQIQKLFPQRVQRRLDGLDDEPDEEIEEKEDLDVCYRRMVQLSKPGEIRKEYEEELRRLEEQQAAERQREEQASASLIQQLCSFEEKKWEETKRQQEEIAIKDAELAQELGRIINAVESETPVSRLLQESRANYPIYPVLSATPALPSQDTSHKGKQPLVKNSNKTLETFFRRLPAGNRTSARSFSEPKSGVSESSRGKGCVSVEAVSARSQSAPVRDKENQPLVPEVSSLQVAEDLNDDTHFYEEVEVGETFIIDSSNCEEVEIGDTYFKAKVMVNRSESASTVHSDDSDSVILCEGVEQAGVKHSFVEAAHFKPIQSSPRTPARTQTNPVPIEPCVVCITPRVLFSTDCLSSSTFPIIHAPVTSVKQGRTGPPVSSANSRQSSTNGSREPGRQSSTDYSSESGRQNRTAGMGSMKSKLWSAECIGSKSSSAVNDVQSKQDRFSRRAKSASPLALRDSPHSRLASCEESHRSDYCHSSLKELRLRGPLQSPIEGTVSDSELSSPSPRNRRHLTRSAAHQLFIKARNEREVEDQLGPGQRDNEATVLSTNNKGNGHKREFPLSAVLGSCLESVSSDLCTQMPVLSKREEDDCPSTSAFGAVCVEPSAFPFDKNDDSRPVSPQPCTSSEDRASPELSSRGAVSVSRPVGILNPAAIPPWSQDLDTNSNRGKGKHLVKKSVDRSLGLKNSPKRVKRGQSVPEKETASCQSAVSMEHTSTASTEGLHSEDKKFAVSSNPDIDNSDRLVRKVKRYDRRQTEATLRVPHKTSQMASSSDKYKPDKYKQKKASSSELGQKSDLNPTNQKSIKDWFTSNQTVQNNKKTTQVSHTVDSKKMTQQSASVGPQACSQRKMASRKTARMSESSAAESEQSSTSSSAATSPDKLVIRMSQRTRKVNPKLDNFVLAITRKLKQFKAGPHEESDSTPVSSPAKAHTTPTATPSKSQKRQIGDRASSRSPAKARKLTPAQTPQKRDVPSCSAQEDGLTSKEEEDEEGLSQEEKDLRLAQRLQRQFDLADKLNLNIVRFKGTDDQYSLRRSRSSSDQ